VEAGWANLPENHRIGNASLPTNTDHPSEWLSPAREALWDLLRTEGPAPARELASKLHLSISAVRNQLAFLESGNLVSFVLERSTKGRPRHVYAANRPVSSRLSAVETLFAAVLQAVEEEPSFVRQRTIAVMTEAFCGIAPDEHVTSLRSRAARVRATLGARGFAPDFTIGEAGAELVLRVCPLLSLASRRSILCEAELECLRTSFPESKVTRIAFRFEGGEPCSYRISDPSSQSAVADNVPPVAARITGSGGGS
jgi:predicted ArsR family transcriptional regulator